LKWLSFQAGNDSCRLRGSFFTPSVFNDFRERGDFFDINLFTDEGSMPAHKVILSACSDFFRDKLRLMQPSWFVFILFVNDNYILTSFHLLPPFQKKTDYRY